MLVLPDEFVPNSAVTRPSGMSTLSQVLKLVNCSRSSMRLDTMPI